MNCQQYQNLIDDLIEDELDKTNRERVNLHVFACTDCAQHYDFLKNEKAIYARYLFEIEPPIDLYKNFQAKLNAEMPAAQTIRFVPAASTGKMRFADFFRFRPALSAAILLAAFAVGLGYLSFVSNNVETTKEIAENVSVETPTPKVEAPAIYRNAPPDATTKQTPEKREISGALEKIRTNKAANVSFNKNNKNKTLALGAQSDLLKSEKTTTSRPLQASKTAAQAKANLPSEEQLRVSELRDLERETAEQIERIELLLRAFRNTRSIEGTTNFDVAYERQLAGKLLAKNVRLRRDAENYGTSDAGEILGKAEPFLLDIANLEHDAAPEKILDIKERVKNQNIIASLQIY